MERIHPKGVTGLKHGIHDFQAILPQQARNGGRREQIPVAGKMVAAPIAALKQARIPAIQVRRFQSENTAGRKPTTDLPDYSSRIVHMLNYVKHGDQVDLVLWQAGSGFHALAEYAVVPLVPKTTDHRGIQFQAIKP